MELSKLKDPFPADRISWRVGSTTSDKSKGMALAYIDARDVQDRLDEVCGVDGWQCRYVPMHDKKTVCEIGIRVSRDAFSHAAPQNRDILKREFGEGSSEWVWKSDGAGDTDVEAEKGSLSDAFKRAAVRWGIGRYLYDVDSPWVEVDTYEKGGKVFVKGIKSNEYARLESLLNRSKPSSAVTPRTQPAPAASEPEKKPSLVEAWGKDAIDRIKGFKTRKEMDEFENKAHLKIASIRPINPELHADIVKAIRDKHAELAE